MTTDQCIAIWAALGNGIAGIGAAIAAGIMARQAWVQRQLEQRRNAWLAMMMKALRDGRTGIDDQRDLPLALYWIHQGVLDVEPPSTDPTRLRVRYRGGS